MSKPCFKLWRVLSVLCLLALSANCCEAGSKMQPKATKMKLSREEVERNNQLRKIEGNLKVPRGMDPADVHYVVLFFDRAGRVTETQYLNWETNRPYYNDEAREADSHQVFTGRRQAAERILEFESQIPRAVQQLSPTLRPQRTVWFKGWQAQSFKTYGEAAAFAAALESSDAQ